MGVEDPLDGEDPPDADGRVDIVTQIAGDPARTGHPDLTGYLESARTAGVLHQIGPYCYVGAPVVEPAIDEPQYIVEYCAPPLLTTPRLTEQLVRHVRSLATGAAYVLLRTPGEVQLPVPWQPHLSYLRFYGAGRPATRPTALPNGDRIRFAEAAERPLIIGWLAWALTDAGAVQNGTVPPERATALAEDWYDEPSRRSLLYLRDGVPIGHATFLLDEKDDVTGEPIVDLIDIIVDDEAARKFVTEQLSLTVAAIATDLGRPLIGNVVHPRSVEGMNESIRVYASLCRKGWVLDYRYWIRPLDTGRGDPLDPA